MAENPLGSKGYAPKAAKMLKMIYDCKVEQTAINHAKKCKFGHSYGSGNGENISVMRPVQKNLTKVAMRTTSSWFGELKKFGVPPDNILTEEIWYRPNKPIGHYTQMVWEDSYKLGCGVASCSGKTFVVCHYSPRGNMIGDAIYTTGKPCKCDNDCKCSGCKCSHIEALCIKPNKIDH